MEEDKLQSVKIRMYRQGFGDCFLLTFNYTNGSVKKMMIDFGVLMGSDGENMMTDIAKDILDSTKSANPDSKSEVDVLVVTHEHWDHFSGFTKNQAQDAIKALDVKKFWLAWTEEKENKDAIQLKNRKKKIKENLEKSIVHLAQKFDQLKDNERTTGFYNKNKTSVATQLSNIVELLKFESLTPVLFDTDTNMGFTTDLEADIEDTFIQALATAKPPKAKKDEEEGLVSILSKVWPKANDTKKNVTFHEAGKIVDLPWAGVRIYSLGPPNDWDYIRRNESAKNGELYLSEKVLETPNEVNIKNPNTFMNSFLFAEAETQKNWSDANIPFDENWAFYKYDKENRIKLTQLENQKLRETEQERIIDNIKDSEVYKLYTEANDDAEGVFNAVRRIDVDYLSYVEPLAMKLNTHTNNTSLVLAIELVDSGKVLLFPGDAQYGNWISWTEKKMAWEVTNKGKKETVTVEDLLARTVFYKVSHHGSHNGTPQNKGLELMKDNSLIAVVPVDEKAAKQKEWHKIPYKNIMTRLQSKAKKINGKPAILRSDTDFETSAEINGDSQLFFDITIENK